VDAPNENAGVGMGVIPNDAPDVLELVDDENDGVGVVVDDTGAAPSESAGVEMDCDDEKEGMEVMVFDEDGADDAEKADDDGEGEDEENGEEENGEEEKEEETEEEGALVKADVLNENADVVVDDAVEGADVPNENAVVVGAAADDEGALNANRADSGDV